MQLVSESVPKSLDSIVRVLHLEDDRADRELVKCLLAEAGINCDIRPVESRTEFVKSVQDDEWDLILSDYALPGFDGYTALKIAGQMSPNTPFIFVTGTLGEDVVVETLKKGATDYVLKQKLARLGGAVRRALNEREEKLARLKAEADFKRSEEQLRFLAYHDALTNLPNRAYLREHLAGMLADADRHNEKLALLFIDLDRFKNINDSLGHTIGDLVLKQVAERLRKCSRGQDTVARLGGDEFVVALTGVKESTDAAIAAERIKRIIGEEFVVQGHTLSTTSSIGISVFPDDGRVGENLLKEADLALYCAKDNGRNGWRFFTQDMNTRAVERLTLEIGLRHAIERNELFVEYQPQVELATGKIVGSEALLRWRHPEAGLISPGTFIPIAENCGEIIRIGEWVLRTACAQAKAWHDAGLPKLPVAVNVSAVQFRQPSFPATVKNILQETGLEPEFLELELTESLLLSNADVVASVLDNLGEMDLKMAIDDFGTGYCGLSYLRQSRFSKLKIDGIFVRAIAANADDAAITAVIISMAKILHMTVIAECVETEEQIQFLRKHHCDEVQGFYFSRPLPAEKFSEMLKAQQLA